MEHFTKYISSSNMTYLPTLYPVYFYGLPDNRIYFMFVQTYDIDLTRSGTEYVLAVTDEYRVDFETLQIFYLNIVRISSNEFTKLAGSPDFRYYTLKTFRNLNSMREMRDILERYSEKIYSKLALEKAETLLPLTSR